MVQTVETLDGQVHEFPDKASPDQIKRALSGYLQPNTQQQPSMMDQASNVAGQFNRHFEGAVRDPLLGFMQETANAPIGLLNFAKNFLVNKLTPDENLMKRLGGTIPKNPIPDIPYFNVAPHNLTSQAGEAAAMVANPMAMLKGLSKAPLNQLQSPQHVLANIPGAENAMNKMGEALQPVKNALHPVTSLTDVFNKTKPKDVATSVQKAHDNLENYATGLFSKVESEARRRGINSVPVDKDLIQQMEQYLPKTRATAKLINDAKNGDYSGLRKAQSELWERGTSHLSSPLPSERNVGEEIMDLRDKINEGISDHFKKTGHHDLNDMLNEAREVWHNLKETYYGKYVPSSISNLVRRGSREVPNNIVNVLSKDSEPMERLRQAHPDISKNLQSVKDKENALKKWKQLGLIGGGAVGTALAAPYAAHKVINVFSGQ